MTVGVLLFPLISACGGARMPGRNDCAAPQAGVISLLWTLAGQAQSSSTCASIASLRIDLSYAQSACDAEITGVDCNHGAVPFLYENLSEGNAGVEIDALDASGAIRSSGVASTSISANQPSQPLTIDLR
jgi:hypothetical protein